MGSKSSTQWKPPVNLYYIMDYKYCLVWVRKSDRVQQMEQYQKQIHSDEQLEEYKRMFSMRIEQPYFPITMYFINHQPKYICSDAKMGSILIQRIPYRLCQFTNISHNESISILFHVLNAYNYLYNSYGLFKIQTTMIGLDRFFKIKVWHHTDFSNPTPQYLYCQSLVEMINSIVSSIQKISVRPNRGMTFSDFLKAKKIQLLNFQLTFMMIKQYAQIYQIKISNKFQNIEKYLRKAEGQLIPDKNIYDMKSKVNCQMVERQHRSQSNPNTLNFRKYSFKKKSIIQDTIQNQNIDQPKNISSNHNNAISKANSAQCLHNNEKYLRSKLYTPIDKVNGSQFDSQLKTQSKKNANTLNDYGMSIKKHKPNYQKHMRAVTEFEVHKEMMKQKENNAFIPYVPRGVVSDLPCMSKTKKGNNILESPYYEDTYTGMCSISEKSQKTLAEEDAISVTIDEGRKLNAIKMVNKKEKKGRRLIQYY